MATLVKDRPATGITPRSTPLRPEANLRRALPAKEEIASALGVPDKHPWDWLVSYISDAMAAHPDDAARFMGLAERYMKWMSPEHFKLRNRTQQVFGVILDESKKLKMRLREPLYSSLGISLGELSGGIRKKLPHVPELILDDGLFRMAAFGGLREQLLDMSGMPRGSRIMIERVYAKASVYLATIRHGNEQKRLYIKDAGHQPDMLAADLLGDTGVIVPQVRNVPYCMPGGETSEYGIMQDIADMEGVAYAVSLRSLARNGRLAGIVIERFDEFCAMLGAFFETCRLLGIQDRHSRNVFVLEMEDGSLALGCIDLDIVACFAAGQDYRRAYAGQLHHIVDCLDFAMEYGILVRAEPGAIMNTLKNETVPDSRARKQMLFDYISDGFIRGAQEANRRNRKWAARYRVWKSLRHHDRKPVGLGCDKDDIKRYRAKRKAAVTYLNGGEQELLTQGPNRGRFMLDSGSAWKACKKALGQDVPDFWRYTFAYWRAKSQDWVPKRKGPDGKIITVAY